MPKSKKYNKKQMLELYKQGMSYEEIAERINSNSVQSVRHSIERWNREVEIKIREEEERKRLRKEKELHEEQIKRKRIDDERKGPKQGLFDYLIDNETWDALEFILSKEYGDELLFDKQNSRIYISEDVKFPILSLNLLYHGFFLELKKNVDSNESPIEIRIMYSYSSSHIDDMKQLSKTFFTVYREIEQEEMRLFLKDLIKEGHVEFDGYDLKDVDESVTPDDIRNRLRSTGYKARIVYDPLRIMNYMDLRVIYMKDGKIKVIPNCTDTELRNMLINMLRSHNREISVLSNNVSSMEQDGFTTSQIFDYIYDFLAEHLFPDLKLIEVNVYPPYFLKLEENSTILKSIVSFQVILSESYTQVTSNRN